MRCLIIFIFLGLAVSAFSQVTVHKRLGDVLGIDVNPNANPNTGQIMPDEYGPAYTPTITGVERHEITFYNFKNEKVMVAEALVQGENYELYGLATWFNKDGYKTEAGFYNGNVRGNIYEYYDNDGTIIETGFYVNNNKFIDFNVDDRLVGTWKSKYISEGYFGQQYPMVLLNRIDKNGSIEIWVVADSEGSSLSSVNSKVTRVHHSFQKTGEKTGVLTTIDYFTGIKAEQNIELLSEDTITLTITV